MGQFIDVHLIARHEHLIAVEARPIRAALALRCPTSCGTSLRPHLSLMPRCGRICWKRWGALTIALQRCAPRRHARRASVGKVLAAAVEVVFEGARRAGGRVNEAMSESRG